MKIEDHIDFRYSDAGRSKYFKGEADDCVVRAIVLAGKLNYKEVYDELFRRNKEWSLKSRSANAKRKRLDPSPRSGSYREVYHDYILELGFKWVPLSGIGVKKTVHLNINELPETGSYILRLSRHVACYQNKKLIDTYDCSRKGTRKVYGYYRKEAS